jgi:alkylation response protein AidB-like acyl-CoA dehydrogenase
MSTFELSPEHAELRRSLRRFAEEQVGPHAAEADERSEYPWKSFAGYRESGFLGIPYPVEHGGDGGDGIAYALLVEEVARVCASSAIFVFISRLACAPILAYGSPELAARVVPRVAAGEWQGSYCLSEPQAGSDVGGMATRAVRDGHDYVLNGRKAWISNAGISDFYTVFAVTDPEAPPRHGISAFVVERDRPGLSIGKIESKMGMRGSPTGELLLDDVVVPGANLIGEEHGALRYAFAALDGSRPIVGAQALGIAQGALDVASRYVKERRQFDQAVADFQGVQFTLADMGTRVEAARLLVYRACAMADDGDPELSKLASMAKLFATDTAMAVTTDAVQLLGGAGYTRDFPVERMMRDAKATQIYEGTNQIQRIVIARRLLDEVTTSS